MADSLIKWTKKQRQDLRKAITNFNKRLERQEQLPVDKVIYKEEKEGIKTRNELYRFIRKLNRFKGKEAYKIVELPSGEKITSWQEKEIKKELKVAKERIENRMKQIEKPYFKMRK